MTKELKINKLVQKAVMAFILSALLFASTAHARILFEDDVFAGVTSEGIILDMYDQATGDIVIQFGTLLGETIKWNATNSNFEFSAGVDLANNQLTTARIENVVALPGGATGLDAEGIGRLVQLTATETTAPGCTTFACYAGQYTWNGTVWQAATNETPTDMVSVKPGENIQAALDSLSATGGTVKLLIGTHDITNSISISKDNVALLGEGPGTVVRAASGSWTGGTTNNDSAIQVGPSNGTSPRDNVTIRNFTLQVGPNTHGIQVNGGSEIKVTDMKLQSIGAKTGSRTGLLFTDGAAVAGSRFTSTGNLINSDSAPNRWVDGVHLDGNADFAGQLFGYGNGIRDSIVSETIVSETQETSFAFSQVSSSSVFSNRGRNIGFTAGAFGLFFNDCNDVMVTNNTMEGSNASATGISIYDNVDNSAFIGNAVRGGPVNYTLGIDIAAATSSGNVITGNQFASVNTQIQDLGTNTKMETLHHRATVNPTTSDDIGDGYEVGTIWINTATDNSWILVDHTIGAAIWKQIDGGAVNWSNLPLRSKEIGLAPEFPDAVLQPDGTENTGSFSAGYDSINLHNYYEWTSSQGTLQDYDIVTRLQLPPDFNSWDATNPLTFNYKTADGNTANNKLDIYLLDTANAVAPLTGNTGLANASWTTYSSTNDLSGGTWTPGQFITVKVRCYGLTGKSAQAGEITLKYNGK